MELRLRPIQSCRYWQMDLTRPCYVLVLSMVSCVQMSQVCTVAYDKDPSNAGANGMDSTELMRELNASIEILLDSENYLLSLNEYMNEASSQPHFLVLITPLFVLIAFLRAEASCCRSSTASAPSRRPSPAASATSSTSARSRPVGRRRNPVRRPPATPWRSRRRTFPRPRRPSSRHPSAPRVSSRREISSSRYSLPCFCIRERAVSRAVR
jgi:hypothetical protein